MLRNLRQCRRHSVTFQTSFRLFRFNSISNASATVQPEVTTQPVKDRYSTVLTGLFAFGTAAIGYGVYEIYRTMTVWPPAVRQDLRDAVRNKYTQDFEASEAYFRRAWSSAKSLAPSELVPQPYLKTTGIAIALGSLLESIGRSDQAYDVYADALSHIQEAGSKTPLSIEEQLRGVTLACKLAEMTSTLGHGTDEEEEWLSWAVQVILKNIMVMDPAKTERRGSKEPSYVGQLFGVNYILGLPEWVSATDLAAPFEALGTLYARTGKSNYALPLLLQATSILVPPPPQTSPPVDRCRGAQTMSAISALITRVNPTEEGIAQAEAWSRKALDIANAAKVEQVRKTWFGKFEKPSDVCDIALAVSMFNIGILRKMAGDEKEARKFLEMSLDQSKMIGLGEGAVAAKEAIEKL